MRWGDYEYERAEKDGEADGGDGQRRVPVWQRIPRERKLEVPLGPRSELPVVIPVPDSGGLELHMLERAVASGELDGQIPPGTRVRVGVPGQQPQAGERPARSRATSFSPSSRSAATSPFVPRPDLRGAHADEWDDQVADLHYADTPEYATGHGIAADWELHEGDAWRFAPGGSRAPRSSARWRPASMTWCSRWTRSATSTMATRPRRRSCRSSAQYRDWIARRQGETAALSPARRRETAEELLRLAGVAADRIERGIAVLREDPDALDAFRVANRAVAGRCAAAGDRDARVATVPARVHPPQPAERRRPGDPHRETVDLLFFPTGGGKTEAYLGLSAFAIVLRRLRHPADGGERAPACAWSCATRCGC